MTLRPPGPDPIRTPWGFVRYFRDFVRDPIAFVQGRFDTFGDMYYAPLGKTQLYVTRHPDHIRQALVTEGAKFGKTTEGRAAAQLKRFLGEGLLNANGEVWRRNRRTINPTLGRQRIAAYADTMVAHAEDMLADWRPGPVEVSDQMMALTLRIVAKVLFDHDVEGETDTVGAAMRSFRTVTGTAAVVPQWIPTPTNRRMARSLQQMDDIVYGLIDARRAQPAEALASQDDLLSVLVRAVEEDDSALTRKQVRDELLTMFLAGHDTTSHALTWTLYLLSQNPEVEAKLHAELDALEGPLDFAALDKLTYTGLCLDEAMRLYPPAPAISRSATEDVQVGGFTIPKGAELLVWIWHTHHDPRWFPEPEAFRPERFAEAPAKGTYLPFGMGSRLCIGKHFALMEAKLVLATICRRYSLRLADGQRVAADPRITLAPRYGMRMVATERQSG